MGSVQFHAAAWCWLSCRDDNKAGSVETVATKPRPKPYIYKAMLPRQRPIVQPNVGIKVNRTKYTVSQKMTLMLHTITSLYINRFYWPTVLSVVPLAQCLVCLSVVVCDILYCGETVRPSEKVSEGVNRKPGSKVHFLGSPPYFYFRFRRYGHRDVRFLPYVLWRNGVCEPKTVWRSE